MVAAIADAGGFERQITEAKDLLLSAVEEARQAKFAVVGIPDSWGAFDHIDTAINMLEFCVRQVLDLKMRLQAPVEM